MLFVRVSREDEYEGCLVKNVFWGPYEIVGARPTLPGKRPHSRSKSVGIFTPRWRPATFRTTLPYAPGTLAGNDGSGPPHIMTVICNVMIGARR